MISLNLYDRPMRGEAHLGNITRIARGYSRTSRAIGGYWAGQFTISAEDVGPSAMTDFFQQRLGCIVKETAGGLPSWEGFIIEMRLILDGVEYMTSLDPAWCHNRVKVIYSEPDSLDSEQGVLDYDPDHPLDSFQDTLQDFSEWESLAAPARYRLVVKQTGADDPDQWGFMGAAFTETNADDSIYIYEDVEMTDEGWASSGRTSPASYQVVPVDGSQQQDTGWLDDEVSQAEYGVIEAILSEGQMPVETAEILRARELAAYGSPRSRPVNVDLGEPSEDSLTVLLAGFWHTLDWEHQETTLLLGASNLISTLVGQSQFVSMAWSGDNGIGVRADCEQAPRGYGDLIEDAIRMGDLEGNIWVGGVYDERGFGYGQGPQSVGYRIRDGRLYDRAGSPVLAPLVRPGFLMRVSNAYLAGIPPGGDVWEDPQVAYVDEVQFVAPNVLRLRLFTDEESIITLRQQLRQL